MANISQNNAINAIKDFECILVDKVFDSCLKKVCFEDVKVEICKDVDLNSCDIEVKFENGVIKPGSLKVLESSILPIDCRRVKMKVIINYIVVINCGGKCLEIPGQLPAIDLDIVLFHPDTRSEFKFDIIVETRAEILDQLVENGCGCDDESTLTFAMGIFIISKVIGKVQLKLDTVFPYCVPPRDCRNFAEMNPCDSFDNVEFPGDFYPHQPTDTNPCSPPEP